LIEEPVPSYIDASTQQNVLEIFETLWILNVSSLLYIYTHDQGKSWKNKKPYETYEATNHQQMIF